LSDTDVSCYYFWMYGGHASDCDGLWQVCGHLPPPALSSPYEPSPLCFPSFGVIFH
jgi:hypothetical protein